MSRPTHSLFYSTLSLLLLAASAVGLDPNYDPKTDVHNPLKYVPNNVWAGIALGESCMAVIVASDIILTVVVLASGVPHHRHDTYMVDI